MRPIRNHSPLARCQNASADRLTVAPKLMDAASPTPPLTKPVAAPGRPSAAAGIFHGTVSLPDVFKASCRLQAAAAPALARNRLDGLAAPARAGLSHSLPRSMKFHSIPTIVEEKEEEAEAAAEVERKAERKAEVAGHKGRDDALS